MLGAGTGVGVADTTAVEAHPSVLTATEVQAYEGDTTNAAAAASGGGETGNDNGTGGAGGKGTVVVGAAAIAEKKDGKVSSGVGKGTFSAQPTAFGRYCVVLCCTYNLYSTIKLHTYINNLYSRILHTCIGKMEQIFHNLWCLIKCVLKIDFSPLLVPFLTRIIIRRWQLRRKGGGR